MVALKNYPSTVYGDYEMLQNSKLQTLLLITTTTDQVMQ
jgi:hypothetical protein